jgi:hypothetical protein
MRAEFYRTLMNLNRISAGSEIMYLGSTPVASTLLENSKIFSF